ncbi:MAG: hypothetical protein CMK07_03065 [Ponticaulis sp.]|nr:hypothetical protein [Ponticaulis sp.]
MKSFVPNFSSLRTRIVVLSAAFSLFAAAAVIWLNEVKATELAETRAQEQLSDEAQKIGFRLEAALENAAADARFAARTPPIGGIIRSSRNDGIDPFDGSTETIWRDRLESIFESMMSVRPDYDQIRFISFDNNGSELVRVERVADRTFIVPEERLQQKGDEPYVQAALGFRTGEVLMVPITNNRENGVPDPMGSPMIRAVVPVADEAGQKYGLVVINIRADALFEHVLEKIDILYPAYIVDKSGDYFYFDPVRKLGTFEFYKDRSSEVDDLLSAILAGSTPGSDIASVFHLSGIGNSDGLKLDAVVTVPRSKMLANGSNSLTDNAALVLLLLGLGSGLVAAFASRMTEPLKVMTDRVLQYRQVGGAGVLQLPTKIGGEIGNLSAAFSELVQELEESKARTHGIVKHAVDGLIVIDRAGIIEVFNPACERMFGYRAEEVIGQNITKLMSREYGVHHDEYLSNYQFTGRAAVIGKSREVFGRKQSGEEFPLEITVSEFRQDGVTYFSGSLRDLSESYQARKEIKQQKETLELALEAAELGLWSLDVPTGRIVFSDYWANMLGYHKSEIAEDISAWKNLVHPEDLEPTFSHLQQYLAGDVARCEAEYRMRHKNGEWVWVYSSGKTFDRDPDGNPVRVVGVNQDITARKSQEASILEQNHKLEKAKQNMEFALDGGELGFWTWDLKTGEVDFCERSAGLIGLRRDQMPSDHSGWHEHVDPEYSESVTRDMARFIKGEIDKFETEFRMRHVSGSYVWVLSKAIISERDEFGNAQKITGIQQDITDRKRRELQVEERNRRLEIAEHVANMGHWSLNAATNEMRWSKGVFEIHGLDPDGGIPDLEDAIKFYHPDDRQIVADHVQAAVEHGKSFEFQLRIIRKTGEMRYVVSRGEVLENQTGNDEKIIFGVFQDVTERVLSERELAQTQERSQLLMDNIVDGVCTINENGIIENCNPACAQIFGYTVEELEGATLLTIIPEEHRDAHSAGFQRLKDTGEAKILGQQLELEGLHKDGHSFTLELAISALEHDGKKFFTGIMRDITERKQVDIMKNEFVSTVNHELRTPLTSIFGSLDLLKHVSAGQLDEKGMRLLKLAHDGCGRLSSLVNDILDVEKIAAGKMDFHMETLKLRDLVDDIVMRHDGLAERFNVQFKVEHDINDCLVNVDASRFNQALVNLLSNAAKFSPEGADVTTSTRFLDDGRVRISVEDHGPGIPENFRARIFERFAQADGSSTRQNTAGTGLGLNITQSIIKAFSGEVSFDSVEGEGTTFHFDLPLATAEVSAIAS